MAWCEESWDGRECVGRKEHIKERRCVEKGGDNRVWEVWAIQDRVKGSGEGECAVLRRDGELGWVWE